jgi:acyl carrier protein
VPPGVAGELALGGVCLARGYLNRPDLTAARFIPDALSGRPGERLYRTGDLVRRLPSGELEFLGRIDHQVKVRGFRIEPGEIEVVLASHPQVQESAVVVREDGAGDRRLIAYVVSETGGEIDPGELRDFLRERLPAYMVPAAFLTLRALPLTASGKVDRAALPAPEGIRGMGVEYVEPKSGLEWTIAAVLGEILGLDRVGIEDNFFDLGVHSLLMVRASNALTERLGRKVQVLEMFRFPTVAALAQHLGQEAGEEEAVAKEQFEQRAEARRQGARRRDRRGRRPDASLEEETEDEPAEVVD